MNGCFVSVDETWIHYYTPEVKEQPKYWVASGGSAPKQAHTVPSAGRLMASVCWDCQVMVFVFY